MPRRIFRALATVLGLAVIQGAVVLPDLVGSPAAASTETLARDASIPPVAASRARLREAYGKLPLRFEPNHGQIDAQVKFFSRGSGYALFLTPTEAVLSLFGDLIGVEPFPSSINPRSLISDSTLSKTGVLRMHLLGANPAPPMKGVDTLPGKSHYLIGNDPKRWHTNVAAYAKVQYEGIYPGIDLIYYGNPRRLEYDFVVAPGADLTAIQLAFEGLVGGHGLMPLRIDPGGDLLLQTAGGKVVLNAPVIYQEIKGTKRIIPGRYVLLRHETQGPEIETQKVGFEVASYDPTRPLVIDPVLVYSTYLGGSDWDEGNSIVVDTTGNAYITGLTKSVDFPTENPLQASFSGGSSDAFIAKLDPSGTSLVYATYLGGAGQDVGRGISIDAEGNVYVAGFTESVDFPTANPLQASFGGVPFDAFIAKLDPTGSAFLYATYLGGNNEDKGFNIAVDAVGNAYVTGRTFSDNFPTANPLQPALGSRSDAFLAKLNPTGSAFVYATYLGGNNDDEGFDIAADSEGNSCVTGGTMSTDFPTANPLQAAYGGGSWDAFVAKLDPLGATLIYSTYLGGKNDDIGLGIAVDLAGNAYVTGGTSSADFPTANPFQVSKKASWDAFVAKLAPLGSTLVYSTYLGGNDQDFGNDIAVDAAGNAYATGSTWSTTFPVANLLVSAVGFGLDAFVTKLGPSGSALVYSIYLGGSRTDAGLGIAVDAAGDAYVTGATDSRNFPTASNPLQPKFGRGLSDAFVTKIAVVHDLAITKIIAPERITLTSKKPNQTKQVRVEIQNRSSDDEAIQDMDLLRNLVSLTVESMGDGDCPAPTPELRSIQPKGTFPLKLKPKKKLTLIFDVTFDCANDQAKSTKSEPDHMDYRYTAAVSHLALDGEADDHPGDDDCPRSVDPPFDTDPYPDGKIKDQGCGARKPDKTFGGDVLTDIVQK